MLFQSCTVYNIRPYRIGQSHMNVAHLFSELRVQKKVNSAQCGNGLGVWVQNTDFESF